MIVVGFVHDRVQRKASSWPVASSSLVTLIGLGEQLQRKASALQPQRRAYARLPQRRGYVGLFVYAVSDQFSTGKSICL